MDTKQKKWLWISIGLSIVILLVVMILTFNENTIESLKNLNPWFLLLAFSLHMTAMCIWALRIQIMCKSLGYPVPLWHCLNMICAGQLIASVTPSQIGGEPVRIHELYKAKVPITDAMIVILIERLMDAVLLVLGVVVGMCLFSIAYSNEEIPGMVITAAWISTGFFVMLLTILAMLLSRPQIIRKIVFKIAEFFTKKWDSKKIEKLTLRIDETINRLYMTFETFANRAKIGLVFGFLLTILFWACEYAIASVLLIGLDYPPNFLLSLVFQLIIAMILMIPTTPGGAGVAEISYAAFYSLILPSAVVGVFVVLLRLILYYSNLLIGFVASFLIVRREATNEVVEVEPKEGEAI
ncbi:MAG: flippase-like domain-containing protein [Methanocalculaceae archaeon]|nr:flippase-like domain-containing protein [Methanocalculaceae archaeon]